MYRIEQVHDYKYEVFVGDQVWRAKSKEEAVGLLIIKVASIDKKLITLDDIEFIMVNAYYKGFDVNG